MLPSAVAASVFGTGRAANFMLEARPPYPAHTRGLPRLLVHVQFPRNRENPMTGCGGASILFQYIYGVGWIRQAMAMRPTGLPAPPQLPSLLSPASWSCGTDRGVSRWALGPGSAGFGMAPFHTVQQE